MSDAWFIHANMPVSYLVKTSQCWVNVGSASQTMGQTLRQLWLDVGPILFVGENAKQLNWEILLQIKITLDINIECSD